MLCCSRLQVQGITVSTLVKVKKLVKSMVEILVIGCAGTGKSLLLKKLKCWNKTSITKKNASQANGQIDLDGSIEEDPAAGLYERNVDVPATKPTIGTNVCNVNLSKQPRDIVLKEIGGSMAPLWKSSYKDASKVIYFVDVSNSTQISASTSLLYEVLDSEELRDAPILLVLNKIDKHCPIGLYEMKYLMGLDEILQQRDGISVVESSIKHETGIADIVQWISAKLP